MQNNTYLNAVFAIETYIMQKLMHKLDRAVFTMHQDQLPATHKSMYSPKKQTNTEEAEKDTSVSEDTTTAVKHVFLMSSYVKW